MILIIPQDQNKRFRKTSSQRLSMRKRAFKYDKDDIEDDYGEVVTLLGEDWESEGWFQTAIKNLVKGKTTLQEVFDRWINYRFASIKRKHYNSLFKEMQKLWQEYQENYPEEFEKGEK